MRRRDADSTHLFDEHKGTVAGCALFFLLAVAILLGAGLLEPHIGTRGAVLFGILAGLLLILSTAAATQT